MSNTIRNWRFGSWHFQVSRDSPRVRLSRNDYHAPGGEGRAAPGWRWFEAY